jgi:predicted porin
MNKKLIALAIAGAFAAPVAMADNSNVTIYGEFAASVDQVKGGSFNTVAATVPPTGGLNAATSESRWRVSSNNSFIGFKGTEDLGNGLSAIWQYEESIAIDQASKNDNAGSSTAGQLVANQSHRNTFVGLASKQMGTVTLGLQDTPFKTSTGPLDIFGQHTLADYRNIFGAIGTVASTVMVPYYSPGTGNPTPTQATAVNGGVNVASVRAQNSVMYTSPDLSGFTIKALGSAANENGNTTATTSPKNPHLYSLGGTYANGPIFASLAYEDNQLVASSTSDFHYKNWRTGVGYSFAGFKVGLAYERLKGDGQATATTTQELQRSAWYLPVSYQMGNNTIKLAYTHAGKSNQKVAGVDLSGNDGAKQWSLGFDHAMSKRTNLYALYTQVRNDTNGSYAVGSGATGIAGVQPASYGETPKAFSVGMVHKF